ncbi:MAG: type II secretion system F family protein [Planctomycetes bacterium]|nr:type II secretion system F family protein [Planctomycetota bacterium]
MPLLHAGPAERQNFFEELHTTVQSGLPLSQALGLMAGGRGARGAMGEAAAGLEMSVRDGKPLSEGMRDLSGCFTPVEVAIVYAGETSGRLEEACRILADANRNTVRLRRTVLAAAAYPILVLHVGIVVLAVPEFFAGGLADFLYALLVPFGVLYGVPLAAWLLWRPMGSIGGARAAPESLVNRLPIIGRLRRTAGLIHATRCLGYMMESGVSPMVAMEAAAATVGQERIRRAFANGAEAVRRGGSPVPALVDSALFPGSASVRLVSSETAGRLPEAFLSLAGEMEEQLAHRLKLLGKVLPLVMILAVAALLSVRVVGFYMGYFEGIGAAVEESRPR